MQDRKRGSPRKPAPGRIVDANDLRSPTEPVDPDVARAFDEAARLGSDAPRLKRRLEEHHASSPELTAGDVDADWQRPDVGEEAPGGTVATPDQDIVEEIGKAVGQTFEDNEPLDRPGKLTRRKK